LPGVQLAALSHRNPLVLVLALILAYALGCLSPGWWLVRCKTGADLRAQGSGVTGATNVGRVLGARAGFLVLVLDAAKGALAVLVARWVAPASAWPALALPAVVAGHIWPAPLRFRGGRGAGPLLGGCVALNPFFVLAAGAPAALAAAFTRRTFVLATAATLGGIGAAWWLLPAREPRLAFAAAIVLVLVAHFGHVKNPRRQIAGPPPNAP
jgi:acyl phosphate:glycerol-3-phosphate acyltransferase